MESDDCGDFIPQGAEGSHIVAKSMASEFTENVVSGNRANLLFVETSLQMIKDN